mmetsp:Transcript_9873/g.36636  ORF Transcript_9873/g.36636 Transcript_9873/m.36636 type:complete len:202 (+) Transcript_9873:2716-3321(+)
MRGMISVRGASGNLGTEGTFKDGTARTVPVRPGALVFFSPTGTATGAGGTYPTRNGVKNVCATAPDPDSTPTTGVVTTEHSVSEARSALYFAKLAKLKTSKYSSWSGYATKTRGETREALIGAAGVIGVNMDSCECSPTTVVLVVPEGSGATCDFAGDGGTSAAGFSDAGGSEATASVSFLCPSPPPASGVGVGGDRGSSS